MKKKKKPKVVYYEDRGQTIYPMSFLDGMTPEEAEELRKKKENRPMVTGRERFAMIRAAFAVYSIPLLVIVGAFALAALGMYFFLK